MNKFLGDLLICPACLPKESALKVVTYKKDGNEIISGYLSCNRCKKTYPIDGGVASLVTGFKCLSDNKTNRYKEKRIISSYLWSHYSDFFDNADSDHAYNIWASQITKKNSPFSLDAGCAAGRFTFELSKKSDFAVGVDLSYGFVRLARQLMIDKKLEFDLITEGVLKEKKTIKLPDNFINNNVEFIVADVTALPFPESTFQMVSSLNIVDKVAQPARHLYEIDRVAKNKNSFFLFSDPFSWSEKITKKELWLGGKSEGLYTGKGIVNVRSIMEKKDKHINFPWCLKKHGHVLWKIRNHSNHYELIKSEYLAFAR